MIDRRALLPALGAALAAGACSRPPAARGGVLAAGQPAAILIWALAPERLIGWPRKPSARSLALLPPAAARGHEPRLSLILCGLVVGALASGPPDAETALALRGPRVATALLTGASLAGAGAAFQILFRNPLVAPDLLGVSSGAGLGAALALIAGGSALMIQGSAFAGGLAAATLALACAAAARGHEPRLSLILCGLVVGALASAGLSLAVVLAEPYSQLPALTWWLLGAFSRAAAGEAALGAAPIALGAATLLWLGFRLDVLSLGDEQARSLGLPAPRLRILAVAAASLMTSSAVALAGVVGWIGLLAPHAARLVVGPQASRLLPASLLTGALFALAVDRLTTAFGPAELPVGLVAAALGAPAFLALFVMTGRRS